MQVYKYDGKIWIALSYTDVLFNNSDKEGAIISVEPSAVDDVVIYVPSPNENIGLVTGLTDAQYAELSLLIVSWLKKTMQKNPDQSFCVSNKKLAYLPWCD